MGHAKLSPSSRNRWRASACPGSIKACENVESGGSNEYSAQGSVAHELAEKMAKAIFFQGLPRETVFSNARGLAGDVTEYDGFEVTIDEEVIEHCISYVDYLIVVSVGDATTWIESQVDLNGIQQGMYGTLDACIVTSDTMYIIDLKYGMVGVSPYKNAQLEFYAAAAAMKFNPKVKHVVLSVFQPRVSDEPKEWRFDASEIFDLCDDIRADVKAVAEATSLKAGSWCKYCAVNVSCHTKMDAANALAAIAFKVGK